MTDQRFFELLEKELLEGLTAEELVELKALLKRNPSFKKHRDQMKMYWKQDRKVYTANMKAFQRVMERIDNVEDPDVIIGERDYDSKIKKWWAGSRYFAAAVVLFIFSFGSFLFFVKQGQKESTTISWQEKVTNRGYKENVTLADGTIVTLNSGTKLRYPVLFNQNIREVYLDGEAFFKVHKDRLHPFIIHTNRINIKVLGTEFNVKSYPDDRISETTLISGAIEVTLDDRPSDRIFLKPKEKLVVYNNKNSLIKPNTPTSNDTQSLAGKRMKYSLGNLTYSTDNDNVVVETSWLNNQLIFNDEDFETIAASMDRWYAKKIVFRDEELKKLRFAAVFKREPITRALKALQLVEDFRYEMRDSVVYIFR